MITERPRLFIECSATYYRGLNTGIQRVVRNIVKRAPHFAKQLDIEPVPVVAEYGEFWTSKEFGQLKTASPKKSSFIRLGTRISARLETHEKGVIERARKFRLLIIYAYAISAVRRLVRIGGFLALRLKFLGDVLKGRVRRIKPKSGDIMLMSDAFWAYDVVQPLLKTRYAPLFVISLIYDLIPITHPEYCASDFVDSFSRGLPELSRRSQGFLAISNATASVFEEYLQDRMGPASANKPVRTWYLGADLITEPEAGHEQAEVRAGIDERHPPTKTLLMVGTIDPRKGHDLVFEALSELWLEGSDYHLVIVGRPGWRSEDLLKRMSQSPYYGKYLHVYTDISDPELHHLYRNVSALVFASNEEGFGLPLVEAMQQGLPVIASDIPVFQEIGGEYPIYFRHGDGQDLKQVLKKFSTMQHEKQDLPKLEWRSWDESVKELVSLCQSIQKDSGGALG